MTLIMKRIDWKFACFIVLGLVIALVGRDTDVVITLEDARSVGRVLAVFLLAFGLMMVLLGLRSWGRHWRMSTPGASLRMLGLISFPITLGAILVLMMMPQDDTFPWSDHTRIVESVIGLVVGIQAALVFSAEDEPSLETTLTYPRPAAWLLLERLIILLLGQGVVALIGVTIIQWEIPAQDLGQALLLWIPTALFFAGLGTYGTLRSRVSAFGAVVATLFWFIPMFFGDFFLPGHYIPRPLHLVQPFIWLIHPYLSPDDMSSADYLINRLLLSGAGLTLIALAAMQLRDEESLLSGAKASRKALGRAVIPAELSGAASAFLLEVRTRPSRLAQLLGMIRYEFKMLWRRRALTVVYGVLLGLALIYVVITSGDEVRVVMGAVEDGEDEVLMRTYFALLTIWPGAFAVMTFVLPLALSDTIPYDGQTRTRELLEALPLPPWVYLSGKILGAWVALLVANFVGLLLTLLMWRLVFGKFDYLLYAAMWLLGVNSLALMNGGLGILIGGMQPTRRRAILLVLACFFIIGTVATQSPIDLVELQNPLRLPIVDYFFGAYEWSRLREALLAAGMGFLQLALVWAAMTYWLHRKSKKV